jgi:hypothetical protein
MNSLICYKNEKGDQVRIESPDRVLEAVAVAAYQIKKTEKMTKAQKSVIVDIGGGMTQSTVLGVATITYLPYCIFNLASPLISLIVAAIGYKIVKTDAKNE